jgi:hypothetical protein
MLRLVDLGLEDVQGHDQDRVILGFFCIAVFGRAVTNAMQNLRTFDKAAFDEWYAPWQLEMRGDSLCRYFYELRSKILKNIDPLVGFVLAAWGEGSPTVGTIVIDDVDVPTEHRGQPIADTSTINLCRTYVVYLHEMFDSFTPMVWPINDRHLAEWAAKVATATATTE